jgi:hypothetical protein
MSFETVYTGNKMGFPIKVMKNSLYNYYCGYVDLPKTHHFYEMDYDTINSVGQKGTDTVGDVQYGSPHELTYSLTYSDFTNEHNWRIGFDTAQGHKPEQEFTLENVITELTEFVMWL